MKPNRLTFWLARCLLVAALAAGIHPLPALDIVVANNADGGNALGERSTVCGRQLAT